MTLWPYTRDIPFQDDNPSDDQPNIEENTNSIDSLIAEDHYSFNISNPGGGLHKQLRLPLLAAIPSGGSAPVASSGTLYTKAGSPDTQLYYTPDQSTKEFQVTRAIEASSATFGPFAPGWTWLPGGLLLQYGFVLTPGLSGNVVFAVPFTSTVLSLTFGLKSPFILTSSPVAQSVSTSGFSYLLAANFVTVLYWTAIGQ